MKSRRRIAFPKAQDQVNNVADYSRDLRIAEWGSGAGLQGGNPEPLMSALGQKRTSHHVRLMSALPPKADISRGERRLYSAGPVSIRLI